MMLTLPGCVFWMLSSGMMLTLPGCVFWRILLLLHTADCVTHKVITPVHQITAVVGERLVLPCYVDPSVSAEGWTVEWLKLSGDKLQGTVHLYKEGRDDNANQNPSFKARTALFKEELKTGNTSLKLLWVRGTDEGTYKCFVMSPTSKWYDDSNIEVHVKAVGSRPVVSIEGHREAGMGLLCETQGWYPEPDMVWRDSEGVSLSADPPETTTDSEGLYTLRLRVTVQKTDKNRFNCKVKQKYMERDETAGIHVPGELFYQDHSSKWSLAGVFGVFVVGLAVAIWFLVKRVKRVKTQKETLIEEKETLIHEKDCLKKEKATFRDQNSTLIKEKNQIIKKNGLLNSRQETLIEENETLIHEKETLSRQLDLVNKKVYQDYVSVRHHAVEVTLDSDTAHPRLILSADGKQVSCGVEEQNFSTNPDRYEIRFDVLGRQSFSSGTFYYEVQVKNQTEWGLGVAKESCRRNGDFYLRPKLGYWTIRLREGGEYEALTGLPVHLHLSQKPQKVGVFVDYEERMVSFYNVEAKCHIYSFTNCAFKGKLYPFFSPAPPGASAPLIICPVDNVKPESPHLSESQAVESDSAHLSESQAVESDSAHLSESQDVESDSAHLSESQAVESDSDQIYHVSDLNKVRKKYYF